VQYFDRDQVAVPAVLRSAEVDAARRAVIDLMLYDHEKRSQTSVPRQKDVANDSTMRAALNKLFRGRCAICESSDRTTPYLFRPMSDAMPRQPGDTSHLYYAWLAHAWENFYAICNSCVPDEPEGFPVAAARCDLPTRKQLLAYIREGGGLWHEPRPESGRRAGDGGKTKELPRKHPPDEQALLLDPCTREKFHEHLRPLIDGNLVGVSLRGQMTIRTFKLNREERVRQRREAFVSRLEGLKHWLNLGMPHSVFARFEFNDMPFGGTWYLLLRRLILLANPQVDETNSILLPWRIGKYFTELSAGQMRELLLQAVSQLGETDSTEPASDDRVPRPSSEILAHAKVVDKDLVPAPATRPQVAGFDFVNFKSLEKLSLDFPESVVAASGASMTTAPALLVLGENAAGKSSVLEGVALALATPAARRLVSLVPKEFVLDPAYLGAEVHRGPERNESSRVAVRLVDGRSITVAIDSEEFISNADESAHALPVFAYGAFRHYRGRARRTGDTVDRHIRNLFDNGELPNPEPWLLSLDGDRFAMVVRALREILSIDGEFEVIERSAVDHRCYVVTAVADAAGVVTCTRTPLSIVSSGFRSVLAMVCDIVCGLMDPRVNPGFESLAAARGVVLVDEIEAHLHPRWKMQIMSSLRRALPRMTFVATTHDPLCLRGMNDGEVVVLHRVPTLAERPEMPRVRVEALTRFPRLDELRVDQLLTSDFFQLHTTSAPEIDRAMARIADLLAKPQLDADERRAVDEFRRDVAAALPVGDTEIHRLVQDAVAEYLRERRAAAGQRLAQLQVDTKRRIVEVLRGEGTSGATRSTN
jgi:hypothetical protein